MMDLHLPRDYPSSFKSVSQIARIATEHWTEANSYCPSCGMSLTSYRAGTKVYDFLSRDCDEKFQLKASDHSFSASILGSEYKTTMDSILTNAQPSLMMLHYDRPRWMVENLSIIHRACITSSCIIPRKPLAPTARRAGWQGCLISLEQIPELGRIDVVNHGVAREKSAVLEQWKRSESLLKVKPETRGWLADVLRCVERLYATFTLANVYSFENELGMKHPNNRNIRPKIRQQLQVLRDLGLVEFVSPGVYRYLRKQDV